MKTNQFKSQNIMKRSIQFLFAVVIMAMSASCTINRSVIYENKTMGIYGAGVMHLPVVADLDVKNEKVEGVATVKTSSVEIAKQAALHDAITKSGADVLVEPSYDIQIKGDKITVKVTGFPANYKNFRQMKPQDTTLIKAGVIQKPKVEKAQGYTVQPDKVLKKVFLGTLTAVGLIVGMVLIL